MPLRNSRISKLRKELGLSQAELAQRIDVSQTTVSRLESTPNGNWDYRVLMRLAQELKTEVHTLIDSSINDPAAANLPARDQLDDDRLQFIGDRLQSPRTELTELHRYAGAYEGLLLATHKLSIADMREIASIPPATSRIGTPPLYRDEPWLQKIVEQNASGSGSGFSIHDHVRQTLINNGEAPDDLAVLRPAMYIDQWPSPHCPLWNACAIIQQFTVAQRSRTVLTPPDYLPDHAQLLLSLHKQDREMASNNSRSDSRLMPMGHLDIDTDDTLVADHEFPDLHDAEKKHRLPKGTPFEEVYSQFGGLRKGIRDWRDPVANAWADGLIAQICTVWRAVTIKLDGELGSPG